mmetsp:Transcript_18112/g.31750  ORF Transcript_18112/g.31750 Transcript_18112/m.31750 type:complete len:742 (+) Transcript_18112:60-2285(+)
MSRSLFLCTWLTSWLAGNALDFTPDDWEGLTETLTMNVVTGSMLVYGELDPSQHSIDDIDAVARRTLGAICEHTAGTSAPVLVNRFQDIKTLGTSRTGLNYTFTLLPADNHEAAKECMGKLAMMTYGPWMPPYEELGLPTPALRKFFAIQLASNYPTRNLDSSGWGLLIAEIACSRSVITRTTSKTWDDGPSTTTTSAAEDLTCDGSSYGLAWDPENTNGFDPSHVSGCNLAGSSPCMCASLPNCEWMPASGTCQSTPNPGVSCAACGWQRKCWAPSQNEICSTKTTACACAAAVEGCTWSSGACIGRSTPGAVATSCVDCPTQASCSLPSVLQKKPAKGAMLGIDGWILEMTFDRPMVFAEQGKDQIWLRCRSYDDTTPPTFQLGESRVQLVGSKLSLNLEGLKNEHQRDCDVIIQSKALYGQMSGLPYTGMEESEYTVYLPDTAGPEVVSFEPENSARAVPLDTKVVIRFSETLRLGQGDGGVILRTVGANPMEELIPMWKGILQISGSKLTLDLSGRLNKSTTYSIAISEATLRDPLGNNFTGLASEIYSFGTVQDTIVVERQDDLTGLYVAISVLAAFVLLAVSMAVAAVRHFQSVRARAKVSTEVRQARIKAQAPHIDIKNLEDLEAQEEPVSPVTPVAPLPPEPPRRLNAGYPGRSWSNPPTDRSSRPSTVSTHTQPPRQKWQQVGASKTLADSAATSKTMSAALSKSMKPQPEAKPSKVRFAAAPKASPPMLRR